MFFLGGRGRVGWGCHGRCEQRSEVFVKIIFFIIIIFFLFFLGGSGWGGQDGCKKRSEVFVKIQKKNYGGGGGGG